jgi:hypothetical protein
MDNTDSTAQSSSIPCGAGRERTQINRGKLHIIQGFGQEIQEAKLPPSRGQRRGRGPNSAMESMPPDRAPKRVSEERIALADKLTDAAMQHLWRARELAAVARKLRPTRDDHQDGDRPRGHGEAPRCPARAGEAIRQFAARGQNVAVCGAAGAGWKVITNPPHGQPRQGWPDYLRSWPEPPALRESGYPKKVNRPLTL